MTRVEVKISFKYKYRGYISFKPKPLDRKDLKRLKNMELIGRIFQPEYPEYPKGIIIDTEVQDLRLQGVNIRSKYDGRITIELVDVKPGSYISIGNLDDRQMIQHQHVYRYRKGRKYHDVWLGMPDGIFHVTMNIGIPREHYGSIIETENMFQKLSSDDVAELEIERMIQGIRTMIDFGLVEDKLDTVTKESTSLDEIEQQQKTKQILQDMLGPDDIKRSLDQLEVLEDEESEQRKKLKESIKESLEETEIRKKWARALADTDQELYHQIESPDKKKESRILRRARRDHRTLKKSNEALN